MSEVEFEDERNLSIRTAGSSIKESRGKKESKLALVIIIIFCLVASIFLIYYAIGQSKHQPVPSQSAVSIS